jgi:ATP-binding cassette, subfamily B, bacterial MsbA
MSPSDRGSKLPLPPDAWQTYRRLIGYIRPHLGMFMLGMLGALMFSASMVGFVPFARYFGDGITGQNTPSLEWMPAWLVEWLPAWLLEWRPASLVEWLPVLLVGLFLLRGAGDLMQTYYMGYVGRQVVKRLRSEIFQRVVDLPINYFDRNSAGALLSRLTYNTEQIGQAATDSVTLLVREMLTMIGSIAALFLLNPRLAVIALTMGPLVAWLISIINRKFRRYSRRIQESMGDITRVAKEALEAPRVIKIYNAQDYQAAQFEAVNEHNRRSFMKLILTKGLSNPVVQSIASVGMAVVLWIAVGDVIDKKMTAGELLAFLFALTNVAQPLRGVVGLSGPLQQGIAGGQSIFEILDEPTEPMGGTLSVERVRGGIEFDNVSFAYSTAAADTLQAIDLKIEAGEMIAIVGRSGSGKSTLVNLLPRFYDVKAGTIRVDGHDLREYRIQNLRQQIALVSQEVILFNDTIRANIAFGRNVAPSAIEEAARAAHVLEFVRDLPAGLDTIVGDRGVLLSGGQRQRIAIARALLKDAPILILDEATSALDTESERIIQAALEELMHNRTTLVIAHRLSTVEKADRIVVLDGGRIVESGTHAQLISRNGQYASLHRMQFNV